MKRSDLEQYLERQFEAVRGLNRDKGGDYTSDEDALSNLRDAPQVGLTGRQKWWVYFDKHIKAVEKYVLTGQLRSEPIETRIQDAVLYLLLLGALIEEEKGSVYPGENTFPGDPDQMALPTLAEVHDRDDRLPIERQAINVTQDTEQSMQGLRRAARVDWPEPKTTEPRPEDTVQIAAYRPTDLTGSVEPSPERRAS